MLVRKTKTLCYCIPIGNRHQEIIPLLSALLRDVTEIRDMIINIFMATAITHIHLWKVGKHMAHVISDVQAKLQCVQSQFSIVVSDSDNEH